MLKFNKSGFLMPDKIIPSSIEELEEFFVIGYSSVERSKLFDEYLRYNSELKELCGGIDLLQWVNGSFVSVNKARPNDIDIVTFIDSGIVQSIGRALEPFVSPDVKKEYEGVDAYIIEIKERFFEAEKAYWYNLFSKTRRNKRTGRKQSKGFLEIIY